MTMSNTQKLRLQRSPEYAHSPINGPFLQQLLVDFQGPRTDLKGIDKVATGRVLGWEVARL